MNFTENFIFLILPVILSAIYFYCYYKINYWKRRDVLQLQDTNLIFGNFKDGVSFRVAPGSQIEKIHHEAPRDAPYIGFYIFHKSCILLRDTELIKQVLIRDFDHFCDRHFAGVLQMDSLGMQNLFGVNNPVYKYLRSKIVPTLTRNKLKQMLPFMIETGQPMMEYLRKNIVDDQSVDVQDITSKYAADLVANLALGSKTDSFHNPSSEYSKLLHSFFHGFKRMVALLTVFFIPEVMKIPIIGPLVFFNLSLARKLFRNALESREKSGTKRGDYIDSMIQLKSGEQDPSFKFEGEKIFDQAAIFFSGLESGSITSAFTVMELAKKKEYQDLAREDVKKAIDKHGWTFEAFEDMKFLDQCIDEGLRLHPPVTIIDRQTREDYKIPNTDVVIEKGTAIFISIRGMHRDPRYFDDPEEFKPERFSEDKQSDAYIPFGAGPKKCIGTKHGKLKVKVVLAMILSEFEVDLIDRNTEEIYQLDTRSSFTAAAAGINLKFKKIIK